MDPPIDHKYNPSRGVQSSCTWVYASDIPRAHRKPDSPQYVLDRPDLPVAAKERIPWLKTARLCGFDLPLSSGPSYSIS